jgi:uncharacterized protein (TIGR03437 family)
VRREETGGGVYLRVAARTMLALSVAVSAWSATGVHLPYLQNMGGDHVTILWSTRENQSADVQFSTNQSLAGATRVSAAPGKLFPQPVTKLPYEFYQYRVDLNGLAPNTTYYYRVNVGGVPLAPAASFTTAASGPFSFLAYGDSGMGTAEQQNVLVQMLGEMSNPNLKLVLHVGDIAYEDGTYDDFLSHHFAYYFSMMAQLPFFPAPGNHEYNSCGNNYNCPPASPYFSVHAPPAANVTGPDRGKYYSYDWGDVHFVALDANLLLPNDPIPQLDWLEADLSATTAKWKIVYWHQTPYPLFWHTSDPLDIASAKWFVPILERHGVQLVLTGHEHEYFRSKPMHGGVPVDSGPSTLYITSGGGGGSIHPVVAKPWVAGGCTFPPQVPANVRPADAAVAKLCEASWWNYLRVEVSETQIVVHAIDMNGVEFDSVKIGTPPVISDGGVVNTASYTSSIAAGGLISIFGTDLSGTARAAALYPLPTNLSGATVTLNNTPLPLFYASANQINAQLPLNFTGGGTLKVTTAAGSSSVPVTVSATAPAVFQSGVLHSSGAPVSATSPAIAGETLVVYLTGLGQVDGSLAAGDPAPASLLSVTAQVTVDLGTGAPLKPFFAGLTPGLAGVYQVNVTLPTDLPTNVYPLRVLAPSPSNTENIAVRGRIP